MDESAPLLCDEPFVYAPPPRAITDVVDKDWVRFMCLLPAKHFEDPLRCVLGVSPVSALHFLSVEALSYVWGSQEDMRKLYCQYLDYSHSFPEERAPEHDRGVLEITPNLDKALRYLRTVKMPRTLYVDAVCINQKDLEEKQHQISLLSNVYANCMRTIIWVGEADSDTRFIFRMMKLLSWVYTATKWVPRYRAFEPMRNAFCAMGRWLIPSFWVHPY